MTSISIVGGKILTASDLSSATVSFEGGQIGAVTTSTTGVMDERSIDASDLIVAPGFMDLQINGGFGLDLAADPDTVWDLGQLLAQHGVTSFCPTIISSPPTTVEAALQALGQRPDDYLGAEPLGLHLEGPMLNPDRRGTHTDTNLTAADRQLTNNWSQDNGIALVTLAPELPGAIDVINDLVSRGITVAAGHSNATAVEAKAGIDAGVSLITHLFNAMAPLGHRQPNLVGVALADTSVAASLIVDGIHVDPIAVAAAWNAKGPNGIVLVTDAVAAMSQPPGTYTLGQQTITTDGNSVRNSSGQLAGSVLTMPKAVRNLIAYTQCPPHQALTAATATPARLIGEPQRGTIQAGATADLVLLNHDFEVQMTICSGQLAFIAEAAADRLSTALTDNL